MIGMHATTGRTLEGRAHLKQRISDILHTPIGSRVKRRAYGSGLFGLVDKPMSPSLMVAIIHATAEAIAKWEREFQLSQVIVDMKTPGHILLDIKGTDLINGKPIVLEGIAI